MKHTSKICGGVSLCNRINSEAQQKLDASPVRTLYLDGLPVPQELQYLTAEQIRKEREK